MSKAQAIPEDAETYVVRAKEAHAPAGKALKELEDITEAQLSRAVKTLKIEEVNQALDDARKRRMGASVQQAETLAHQLFKDKTPDQIKEIIKGLTPEMIQNLQLLAQATDPVAMAMVQRQQPAQPAKSETETLITMLRLWKEMQPPQQPQNALTLEGVAALIKAVQPQAPQQGSDPMEVIKLAGELNKPVIDMMRVTTDMAKGKDKEIIDLKMKELENKLPQDPVETIKYVKEMSGVLGLGNAKSDIDLRLAEMRQNENIDLRRLDWEQKKAEMDSEADNVRWEQITKILQGPIGQAISNMGSAGADRVRGRPNSGRQQTAVQTQCPSCNKIIYVDASADSAVCSLCGAFLSKGGSASPPQPPAPSEPPEPELQPQKVESPATSEDEQAEEEQSNEPNEAEATDEDQQ